MSAYAIAYLRSITDPKTFDAYRAVANDALAKHGGRVAKAQPKPDRLEGDLDSPDVLVMLEFETEAGIRAWRDDPELTDIHALRTGGADVSILVLGEV